MVPSALTKQQERQAHPLGVSPLACPAQRTTGRRTASSRTQRQKAGPSIANPRFGHPATECRHCIALRCDPSHTAKRIASNRCCDCANAGRPPPCFPRITLQNRVGTSATSENHWTVQPIACASRIELFIQSMSNPAERPIQPRRGVGRPRGTSMGIRERIATYRFAEKCAETSDKVIALWESMVEDPNCP